jgi:hypothetical protein
MPPETGGDRIMLLLTGSSIVNWALVRKITVSNDGSVNTEHGWDECGIKGSRILAAWKCRSVR